MTLKTDAKFDKKLTSGFWKDFTCALKSLKIGTLL